MFDFSFLLTAILLVVIDSIYLNLVKDYFGAQIKSVQGSPMTVNFTSAAVCYVFLVCGLYYFIVKPRRSIQDAFLLGLVIYGVYETTNFALLKNWYLETVVMDTLWGGVLFALTSFLVQMLSSLFRRM